MGIVMKTNIPAMNQAFLGVLTCHCMLRNKGYKTRKTCKSREFAFLPVSLKTVQIFHSKTTQLCDTSPLVKPACNGQDSKSIHTYKAGFYHLKDEYL